MDRESTAAVVGVLALLVGILGMRHVRAEDGATVDGRPVRITPASVVDPGPPPEVAPGPRPEDWFVVQVDLARDHLDLLGQGPTAELRTLDAARAWVADQGRTLVAVTNAGIFEPDLRPTGLFVSGGEILSPLNTDSGAGNFFLAPNGVFAVDDQGRARVQPTAAYGGPAVLATQSGPLLLTGGRLHPRFRADSPNLRVRSGVGVSRDDPRHVFLAISRVPVRFHDMATFFRDTLACDDALYLDGVISGMAGPAVPPTLAAPGPFAGLLVVSRDPAALPPGR